MKLNIRMPKSLVVYYDKELISYRSAIGHANFNLAWLHLERAHIIGQRYPWPHTEVHWLMLHLGLKTRSIKEVFGQMIRLVLGAPFSFIDNIPEGNVGSSRVSIIKVQAIPEDIAAMFSQLEH